MKILVEILHGIGDTVCALPMLEVLRNNYPEASITVLVKGVTSADIIKASSIKIEKIITLDIYKDNFLKTISIISNLRKKDFDFGINCAITHVKKAKLFMNIISCKKNIGIQHELHKCFDDLNDNYHFVDANLLAIQSICKSPAYKIDPQVKVELNDMEFVKNYISNIRDKKIIGLCIGNADFSYRNRWIRSGKVFTRGWGIKNMSTLLAQLLNDDYGVILIGGKLEVPLLEEIDDKILKDKNLINCVNKTNLKQSMAVVKLCDLVIGVDTGMQHIADAVGSKTLSIFGPTNPKTHGAYSAKAEFLQNMVECQYCYASEKYISCTDRKCLKNIVPGDVIKKIRNILKG